MSSADTTPPPTSVTPAGASAAFGASGVPGGAAAPSAGAIPLSVLVLARNDQTTIEACLRSLNWCGDIVVLDARSTDRTADVARTFPHVRVFQRAFDTAAAQRDYALKELSFQHEWLYITGADECVPVDLVSEMAAAIAPGQSCVAFSLRARTVFRGRWLRHAPGRQAWSTRLVRTGRVRFEDAVTSVGHPQAGAEPRPIVDGPVGRLKGRLVKDPFHAGLKRWFDRINDQSDVEATLGSAVRPRGGPAWRFISSYFLRGGFLDGVPGFHYCLMMANYEYWTQIKVLEREHDWHGATEDAVKRLLQAPGAQEGGR